MSYDVSVFFRGLTLPRAIEILRVQLGTPTTARFDGGAAIYDAEVFGISMFVAEAHDFEDDVGISFTRYTLYANFKLWMGRMPSEAGCQLVRALARALQRLAMTRDRKGCLS